MAEPDIPDPVALELGDELHLFNIAFSPEVVEIDFLDPRRQAKGVTELTKIGIERRDFEDEVESIEEAIRDLVDEALRRRRK